jgi:hypothetical protein
MPKLEEVKKAVVSYMYAIMIFKFVIGTKIINKVKGT